MLEQQIRAHTYDNTVLAQHNFAQTLAPTQLPAATLALRDISKPTGVATYTLTDTLPAELRPFFPSYEELVRRLDAVAAAWRG